LLSLLEEACSTASVEAVVDSIVDVTVVVDALVVQHDEACMHAGIGQPYAASASSVSRLLRLLVSA